MLSRRLMTLMRRTMLTFTMTEFLERWPLKKLRRTNVEQSIEDAEEVQVFTPTGEDFR